MPAFAPVPKPPAIPGVAMSDVMIDALDVQVQVVLLTRSFLTLIKSSRTLNGDSGASRLTQLAT